MTLERLEAWGREHWLGDIVRAARICPDHAVRVLEAGCGTGQYSLALALRGYEVDALDYNAAALDRARELIATVGAGRRAPSLLNGDLLCLPTATDAYDLVFNQQVMEYFVDPEPRHLALAQMVRTTKPGGVVVVVVARPGHPLAPAWRRFGWPGFIDQPEMVDLTPRRLEDELRAVGLVDVASDGIAAWRALFFWPRWYERWSVTRRAIGSLTRLLERVPLPRGGAPMARSPAARGRSKADDYTVARASRCPGQERRDQRCRCRRDGRGLRRARVGLGDAG